MKLMLYRNNQGAVSMITVMFVAIIMTVLVLGLVRVMVSERRQSTDDDLTTRAFYAAESGVEGSKVALAEWKAGNITTAELEGNNCDVPDHSGGKVLIPNTSLGLDTEITCQKINVNDVPNIEVNSSVWDTQQYILNEGNAKFNTINIAWHNNTDDSPYSLKSNSLLDTVDNWTSAPTKPAALKIHIFTHPKTGSFNRSDISSNNRQMYLIPVSTSYSSGLSTLSFTSLPVSTPDTPIPVTCAATVKAGYACNLKLQDVPAGASNVYIRVSTLYIDTNYQISIDTDGSPVNIPGQQAIVDVTGKAGDIFRRVLARVDLTDNEFVTDHAIIANGICKDFALTDSPDDFHNINIANISNNHFCNAF